MSRIKYRRYKKRAIIERKIQRGCIVYPPRKQHPHLIALKKHQKRRLYKPGLCI